MYDLIDQPAAALGNGSRLILWAMRGWVGALARGVCPPVSLAPAFAKLGLIPVNCIGRWRCSTAIRRPG